MSRISGKILVTAGLMLFILIGIAAMKPVSHKPPRNLKVLPRDISDDSLYAIMGSYEKALGVNCSFCHVMKDKNGLEDYTSDSIPHKEVCRDMMRMTILINTKYFPPKKLSQKTQTVTCYTCHKGKQIPEAGK